MTGFSARRARRILPAATVVILATWAATCGALGLVAENPTAEAGRWTAVFLSNFHSIWSTSNYFGAPAAQSPLLHFKSVWARPCPMGVQFVVLDQLFYAATACPAVAANRIVYENYHHAPEVWTQHVAPGFGLLIGIVALRSPPRSCGSLIDHLAA